MLRKINSFIIFNLFINILDHLPSPHPKSKTENLSLDLKYFNNSFSSRAADFSQKQGQLFY